MKKYNLSEIMKSAWSIRRMTGCTMSTALRQSWAQAKKPVYEIKGWFMSKNFSDHERLAIVGVSPILCRETEKAVNLCWNTKYGKIVRWVPKSCLGHEETTREESEANLKAGREREARYEDLIAKCRANGIPARKGWRVSTMKQRLAEVAA